MPNPGILGPLKALSSELNGRSQKLNYDGIEIESPADEIREGPLLKIKDGSISFSAIRKSKLIHSIS